MILEDEIDNDQVVTDKPEPDFAKRAATDLNNASINPQDRLRSIQEQHDVAQGPIGLAPVKYNQDKIVYKIAFNLPNAGLAGDNVIPEDDCHQRAGDHNTHPTEDILADKEPRQYPT